MEEIKKIFILEVDKSLMPEKGFMTYPRYNVDYGVEQDFYNYIINNAMVTDKPEEADLHYLPVYWTRSYYNELNGFDAIINISDYLNRLDGFINKAILDNNKTFTICQLEDGPMIDLGSTKVFSPAKRNSIFIDIPFIRSTMKKSFCLFRKKYRASFIGRTYMHESREELFRKIGSDEKFYLKKMSPQTKKNKKLYSKVMATSLSVFCPRSYGSNSFRFFEAMEMGAVPILISDMDVRPFKDYIAWDDFSFYTDSVDEAIEFASSTSYKQLSKMGKQAYSCWEKNLSKGNWCRFIFDELKY